MQNFVRSEAAAKARVPVRGGSAAQVEDRQKVDPVPEEYDDDGEYEDENPSEDEQEGADDDEEYAQILMKHNLQHAPLEVQRQVLELHYPHFFRSLEADDSYPTTTSGVPDDVTSNFNGIQEADDFEDQDHVSPTPPRKNYSRHRSAEQPPQRQPSASGPTNAMQNQSNLFQRGNIIRANDRAGAPQQHQRNITAPQSSQQPTYSQAVHTPSAPAPQHVNQLPRAGTRQIPRPRPVEPAAPSNLSERKVNPGPSLHPTSTTTHLPVKTTTPELPGPLEQENIPSGPPGRPIEDYDQGTLKKMTYNQLKAEGFDHDPRAEPAVLSDDMLKKPLPERLTHVQKSLDEGDQAKFFHSLPTAEWEEAGDWFLEQFSNIIQRTREARQTKRKLAKEFEDEVEQRHVHVDKKRHQVDDALEKMKNQGQGLIPKSPRPSKSPGRH